MTNAVFLHDFSFFPHEPLLSGSIPVNGERQNGAHKSGDLEQFTLFELLQASVLLAILVQVSSHADAGNIAAERPANGSPHFVALGLHHFQITLVVQLMHGNLGHICVLILEFIKLLGPAIFVLDVRVVKLIVSVSAAHPDLLGFLEHAGADSVLVHPLVVVSFLFHNQQ